MDVVEVDRRREAESSVQRAACSVRGGGPVALMALDPCRPAAGAPVLQAVEGVEGISRLSLSLSLSLSFGPGTSNQISRASLQYGHRTVHVLGRGPLASDLHRCSLEAAQPGVHGQGTAGNVVAQSLGHAYTDGRPPPSGACPGCCLVVHVRHPGCQEPGPDSPGRDPPWARTRRCSFLRPQPVALPLLAILPVLPT